MIKITSISGNIFRDKKPLKTDSPEYLLVSRSELDKSRLRAKTDKGTDIGLVLESDNLHNGDILSCDDKNIIVKQLPEKLIAVKLRGDRSQATEVLVMIGHVIGNRHRPISVVGNHIYFPIQADSELGVFEELFSGILDDDDAEFSIQESVFEPLIGTKIHEH